jgi:hypothetical protein
MLPRQHDFFGAARAAEHELAIERDGRAWLLTSDRQTHELRVEQLAIGQCFAMGIGAQGQRAIHQASLEMVSRLDRPVEIHEHDCHVETDRRMIPVSNRFLVLHQRVCEPRLDEVLVPRPMDLSSDRLLAGRYAGRPGPRLLVVRYRRKRLCLRSRRRKRQHARSNPAHPCETTSVHGSSSVPRYGERDYQSGSQMYASSTMGNPDTAEATRDAARPPIAS